MKYKQRFWMVHASWALLAMSGCFGSGIDGPGDTASDDSEVGFDTPVPETSSPAPSISHAEIAANPNSTLSAVLEVDTTTPTRLLVKIRAVGGQPRVLPIPPKLATSHRVPVLGMHAETEHEISIIAASPGGKKANESLTFTTGALPDDFPPISTTISYPAGTGRGVTIFPVGRLNPAPDPTWGYLVAVDRTGEVVWYYEAQHSTLDDVDFLSNGNIAYIRDNAIITEIDMLGNVVNEWSIDQIGADGIDSFHHELIELPSGNFMVLSSDLRTIDGYTDDDGNPVSHRVVADVILEFDRNGNIVDSINLFDLVDPFRVRLGFDDTFWDRTYGPVTKDLTHGNALAIDPTDGNLVISLRHQDWIVKIDRDTGNIIWTFGEEGDFALIGGGEFAFHHHAPAPLPNGNILVYDNGNGRSSLEEGEAPFTRAVEFALDEDSLEAEQVWEFRDDVSYFSAFLGDVDRLRNGNTLITNGGILDDPFLSIFDPTNQISSRIVELNHKQGEQKVLEITIRDSSTVNPIGYAVYRSERRRSLYPRPVPPFLRP